MLYIHLPRPAPGPNPWLTVAVHDTEEWETGFWGEILEIPGCYSQGETIEELIANLHEAMEIMLDPPHFPEGGSLSKDIGPASATYTAYSA